MDLEVAHAIAPDAQKVVINARPTVEGDGGVTRRSAQMLEDADRQFPGAVWSFSIGWGCDKLITAADLAPVRSAIATAHANGTTAFNASGDLAGLECKGGQDWSSPPSDARRRARLGRLAAGDDRRRWHHLVDRCRGQYGSRNRPGSTCRCRWAAAAGCPRCSTGRRGSVRCCRDSATRERRLTPDVAAVADQFTGVKIVFNGETVGRRRHVTVGADLGRPGRGDEPVPRRRTAGGRSAT